VLEIFVFGIPVVFAAYYISGDGFEEAFTMSIFRALLISAAVLAMTSAATFAQVRVITGDTEHYYGPGGQLLDDETLRLQN
jgi:hypothetical protein